MAPLKTQKTAADVAEFIASVEHPTRRTDSETLLQMMSDLSDEPARMWGKNIVGFGSYTYKYASGRSGDWMRIAFSPRKSYMSLYIMSGAGREQELLDRLGKHKVGKSCLNINKLADVDLDVLKEIVVNSLAAMDEKYPRTAE